MYKTQAKNIQLGIGKRREPSSNKESRDEENKDRKKKKVMDNSPRGSTVKGRIINIENNIAKVDVDGVAGTVDLEESSRFPMKYRKKFLKIDAIHDFIVIERTVSENALMLELSLKVPTPLEEHVSLKVLTPLKEHASLKVLTPLKMLPPSKKPIKNKIKIKSPREVMTYNPFSGLKNKTE